MNGPAGHAIGGVLLGTRLGNHFRVTSYRPIICTHSLGPDFRLSPREEGGLSALLDGLDFESARQEWQPLGWFVTHPRGDTGMNPADEELHNRFFSGRPLALVVRPDRLGEIEVAIYFTADGATGSGRRVEPVLSVAPNGSSSPLRMAGPGRRRRSGIAEPGPAAGVPVAEPDEPAEPAAAEAEPAPPLPSAPRDRAKQVALVSLGVLLACCAALFYWGAWNPFGAAVPAAPARKASAAGAASSAPAAAPIPVDLLSLHGYEDGTGFLISWNGRAEAFQSARRVVLLIHDGDRTTRRQLSRREAAIGLRRYRRRTGEINVTLQVHGRSGAVLEETTHFSGAAPAPPRITAVPAPPAVVADPGEVLPAAQKK